MRKPLNVLLITPHFKIGGTESQVFNIATRMDRSRFVPYVISVGEDCGQAADYLKNGVEARSFRLIDFFKIASFIKAGRIDIVHSFYYGDFAGWELIAARLAGVRVFLTSRRNIGYWRKPRHYFFDIFRNRFTDLVIANSEAVKEKAVADEKMASDKIAVVYNGIDCSMYEKFADPDERRKVRKELNAGDSDKIIGMIGTVKKVKGYEFFLCAANKILEKNKMVRFVIAGRGSDTEYFKKMVERYKLDDRILLLGESKDVKKILASMDIFMYSSLSEGLPNVILEAMALGKPIVSTDVGGIKEVLRDGQTALLVPSHDPDALAKAAEKLLQDAAMAGRIGTAAREEVRRNFGIDKCVRQYEVLYEKIYQAKGDKRQ